MPDYHPNPAGRILHLVDSTLESGGAELLREIWLDYFQVSNETDYLAALVTVLNVSAEARKQLLALKRTFIPRDQAVEPFHTFEKFVHEYAKVPVAVDQFRKTMQPRRDMLLSTSEILDEFYPTAVTSEVTLDRIRNLAYEIATEVTQDGSLDTELRAVLLRYAHNLMRLVDMYKVTGGAALKDEADRFFAEAWRTETLKRAPESLWKKAMGVTGVVLTAVDVFVAPQHVTEAIDFYLNAGTTSISIEAPAPDYVIEQTD
ncbi:hypothetical protein [Microbacterium sp.]|uniref:hypothetical protein n=1 Tax=Microbacterium sp. TaxID=51671 RepID=UPI001ACF03D7|nr:hypothetical protein [Microbacterium sp.]MBN9169370.1 hypothetical protein [Microbacterium sp.]MBN9179837.1 hypothetical protein [Microbacterium sp.]MBN9194257.1 hypothetical protein [Microbacterium sp.]